MRALDAGSHTREIARQYQLNPKLLEFLIVLVLSAVLMCEPGCTRQDGFAERADPTNQSDRRRCCTFSRGAARQAGRLVC